jgi:hypothetical protein
LEQFRAFYKAEEDPEAKKDWKIEIATLVADLYKGKELEAQLAADQAAEEAVLAKKAAEEKKALLEAEAAAKKKAAEEKRKNASLGDQLILLNEEIAPLEKELDAFIEEW